MTPVSRDLESSQELALCGHHQLLVGDAGDVPDLGAAFIGRVLVEAVEARGTASVALSIGTTLRPIYRALAGRTLPWDRVELYFCDERCVPPDHLENNCRAAREALFDVAPIPPENVHRIRGERDDREAAAAEYGAALPDELDLVILELGEDYHTASLFPGTDWSHATGRKMIVVDSPRAPHFRLTITPDVIAVARTLLVVAAGADSARQVKQALWGGYNPYLFPVQLARRGTWLLDRAAAAELETEEGHYA